MKPKLWLIEENHLGFDCPGCGFGHGVTVNGRKNERGASWQWNGSLDAPTFKPSVFVFKDLLPDKQDRRCHSVITDGRIQFLPDCFHKLAGQTVELPDRDD